MSASNRTILILGDDPQVALHLKELVEFMDVPHVITAMPGDWKARLGDGRLEALFVNPELPDETVCSVLDELSEFDPNVSVVMLEEAV